MNDCCSLYLFHPHDLHIYLIDDSGWDFEQLTTLKKMQIVGKYNLFCNLNIIKNVEKRLE